MASQNYSFRHKPLDYAKDSIRLLKVHPDLRRSGSISCEIWHANPSASYCCLSYRWGSPGSGVKILLNGKSLKLRPNLWNFLHVARQRYAGINLWIDALCIDQNDEREKNHQVSIMGKIYREATTVFIWLGRRPGLASPAWDSPSAPLHATNDDLPFSYKDWKIIQ